MDAAFAALAEFLKDRCARGPVIYFANPGNWGDAVIRHGTLTFLRDIGLRFQEIRSWKQWTAPRPEGGTVLYGGGGGWSRLWVHSQQLVTKFAASHPVIVLPSSYELRFSIAGATFFRRDRWGSKATMPEALFCHDMAFYLDRRLASSGKGEGRGCFLRVDAESAGLIHMPPENDDISFRGGSYCDLAPFYAAVDRFSEIHTDRLHVAIAACLLGKELHMYPGCYFKNRDVYRSSIEGRFENTTFHGDLSALARGEGEPRAERVFQLTPGYEVTVLADRTRVRGPADDRALELRGSSALILHLMDGRRGAAEIRLLLQATGRESSGEIARKLRETIARLLRAGAIQARIL